MKRFLLILGLFLSFGVLSVEAQNAPQPQPPAVKKHARGHKTSPNLARLRAESVSKYGAMLKRLPRITAAQWDCRTLGLVGPVQDQGQCGSCFPKGAKVSIGSGLVKNIEDIVIGDVVVSAEGNRRAVTNTYKQLVNERLMTLQTEGGFKVTGTDRHPILTKRGYICLHTLNNADEVATFGNGSLVWRKIVGIVRGPTAFEGEVYDLRVAEDASYVANGIGVHNCWDFSGTDICTSAMYKAGILKNDGTPQNYLCQQYTLDCGKNGGCDGDDNVTVTAWAKLTGLPTQAAYGPYTASSGRCKSTTAMTLYKLADSGFCTTTDQQGVAATQDIKNAMVAYGPIGSGVDASRFDSYTNGVLSGTGHSIDHDIVLVGWDDTKGKAGAWLLRNSWNTSWGIQGYMWIEYGAYDVGTEAIWAVATPVTPPTPPTPILIDFGKLGQRQSWLPIRRSPWEAQLFLGA